MSTRPLEALSAGLLLAGCSIPPASSIGSPAGLVEPRYYCAGDTVSVTHSIFYRPAPACLDQPGHRCADIAPPRVTLRAVPSDFPEQTTTAQGVNLTFVPSGDAVDVQFLLDPNPYGMHYTTWRGDGSTHQVIQIWRSNTISARRIVGTTDVEVASTPRCGDTGQFVFPNEWVPIPEGYSRSVQGLRVCNRSSVPIIATLHDLSSGGPRPDIPLDVGACADTSGPEFHLNGIEPMVTLRPAFFDPKVVCATPARPPFPLRVQVTLGCLP